MAFQLSNKEIVQHHFHTGLARVLLEQVQQAETIFASYSDKNHAETIEKARACICKILAVMDIIAPFIGSEFNAERRGFKQLLSSLSEQFEQNQAIRALEKLKYLSTSATGSLSWDKLKEQYLQEKNAQPELKKNRRKFVDQALVLLLGAQKTFQVELPEIHDIDLLEEGLESSNQEVARIYNNCISRGKDEDFQELHSTIGSFIHQTEVLQNFSFAPTHIRRKFLERLSSKLDLYNDLTTLVSNLKGWRGKQLSHDDFQILDQIVDTQKKLLSIDLLQLGKKIFKANTAQSQKSDLVH